MGSPLLQAMKSAGRRKASAGSARISAGALNAAPGRRASAGAGMLFAREGMSRGVGVLVAGVGMLFAREGMSRGVGVLVAGTKMPRRLLAGAAVFFVGVDMPRRVGVRENSGAHSAPRLRARARMRVNMWRAAVIYRLKISKSWQKRGGESQTSGGCPRMRDKCSRTSDKCPRTSVGRALVLLFELFNDGFVVFLGAFGWVRQTKCVGVAI